ncbi:zinc finger protein 292b [Synchiropus splendidus]|uniref:zinc finger protein 292b n=1 Tax=Synchiropus splendidus TaxID=270530 RepID=UPI00237D3BB7|nr:zinc finger protein 292b [Synchiropus splendidus]
MADEEAEQDRSPENSYRETISALQQRLTELQEILVKNSEESPDPSSSEYCQELCRIFVEYAGRWKVDEEPVPLLEVYIVALLSYAQASPHLSLQCENVPLVVERLSLSFVELLLSLKEDVIPEDLWKYFQQSVKSAHSKLQENGISQLGTLSLLAQYDGVWTNIVLQEILSNEKPSQDQVEELLVQEGPVLLQMRVKQLMKDSKMDKAALLAKACADCSAFKELTHFKSIYLVSICSTTDQDHLMEELAKEDCQNALEMICNLESEGDETSAFSLCSAFLTRQLLQGDMYCAWELTLFWSKLLKRVEPSEQAFLDKCRQMSSFTKSVFHILFLIKVVQSEMETVGLPVCIEMCIRALRMESIDGNTKATVCKTISCLLPTDLEVKRACQLTEFLLEPTVDSYYAVETLYNEPDEKLDEESMPVPNSLRCELLLVFKTQWPFDPEFWDWKTLKRQCLALMGEEASIVSSIDLLNDEPEEEEEAEFSCYGDMKGAFENMISDRNDVADDKEKKREMKKLREKGFISARFRNWQAYMQYCVLCDKEFLGHRIVRHAQTHVNGGEYTCPICAQTFPSKDTLLPHVTSHVKASCKERLGAVKSHKKLTKPSLTKSVPSLSFKAENNYHKNGGSQKMDMLLQPQARYKMDISEINVCPVGDCKRSFKFFKNLIAHVKTHADDEEALSFLEMYKRKVVCQYCRRHFINVAHLNDHLQVHCGAKPYICIQLNCKASFESNNELYAHRKIHSVFKAKCMFPKCGKIFNEAFKLYNHEACHYKTFTCSVADCGKVFHTQQLLEVHVMMHSTRDTTPAKDTPDPGPSLIKQMLIAPPKHANLNTEPPVNHREIPHADESLLKSEVSTPSTEEHCKTEALDTPAMTDRIQGSVPAVIQPVNSISAESSVHRDAAPCPSANYRIPQSNVDADPNHSDFHLSHNYLPSAAQNQPQNFMSNRTTDPPIYDTSPCMMPQASATMCNSNVLRAAAPQRPTQPVLSQPLPSTGMVAPQPQAAMRPQTSTPVNSTAPITVQKERFHCAYETCFKHYSSHKNVIKHMKSSHPDFYEQWKLIRGKVKTTFVTVAIPPPAGKVGPVLNSPGNIPGPEVQRQNVIHSPTYSNFPASGSHSSQPPYIPSHNRNTPLLMNTLKSPPVPPPHTMDTSLIPPHVKVEDASKWSSVNPSDRSENPSQVYPSSLQSLLQVDSNSSSLALNVPPRAPADSLIQHSQILSAPDAPIAPRLSQTKSCTNPVSNKPGSTEATRHEQQPRFPTMAQKDDKGINLLLSDPFNLANDPEHQKRMKRSKRSKWPAILKDGKFFCSRCYRQFNSPKSLGGHLSKRSSCKPYEDSELSADLPASFLELLNSESPMHPSTLAPPASYRNETDPSIPSGPINDKPFASVNYSEEKMADCDKGQSTEDILKQIMRDSNMANPFVPPTNAQHCYPTPNVPYGVAEHLPGKSVIQHTENVLPKRDNNLFSKALYQQSMNALSASEFPDARLSQIKTESNTPASHFGSHSEHEPARQSQRVTCHPGNPSQIPDSTANPLQNSKGGQAVTWGRQALPHVKTEEQDVKERLREQILSGTFQLRNRLQDKNISSPSASCILASSSSAPFVSQLCSAEERSTPARVLPEKSPKPFVPVNDSNNSFMNQVSRDDSPLTTCSTDLDAATKFPFVSMSTSSTYFCDQMSHSEKTCEAVTSVPKGLTNSPFASVGSFNSSFLSQMACVDNALAATSTQPEGVADPSVSVSNSSNPLPNVLSSDENSSAEPEKPSSLSTDLEQLLGSQSFSGFRESAAPLQELLSPTGTVSMEADTEPTQLSSSQLQWMAEIQSAFERLNLLKELSDLSPTSRKATCNDQSYLNQLANKLHSPSKSVSHKPFVCNYGDCNFGTISGESFWKHLSKSHNYTIDMINEIKRKNGLYAPFKCLKCSKTYTRNSNLRVHYQSYHKLSANEISELDVRRRSTKSTEVVSLPGQPASTVNPANTQNTEPSNEKPPEPCPVKNEVKTEYQPGAIIPHSSMDTNKPSSFDNSCPPAGLPTSYPTTSNSSISTFHSAHGGPVTVHWANQPEKLLPRIPQQFLSSQPLGDSLASVPGPCPPSVPSHPPAPRPWPSEQLSANKLEVVNPDVRCNKKAKDKKAKPNEDANSPYRPYRCVHQGCVAAFTIQQNLILHYKAVHQSALSALTVNEEQEQSDTSEGAMDLEDGTEDGLDVDLPIITEMRCQVKDCSRLFQDGSSLLQHYTRLHEFSVERVSRFFTTGKLGKFECGYLACKATFSSYWPYIAHVKEQHKDFKLRNHENLNGSFKCEIEGCDRRYTTKSNMLRHVMKNHHKFYQSKGHLMKDEGIKQNSNAFHLQITKTSNGKENIETNKKFPQKMRDGKKGKKKISHWTNYGKPSLKSKVEAAAMCNKPFALQYPCMIKGCEAVMKSEKRILKHYIDHGLSEKYLEEQRSGFIFCKKSPKFKSRHQRNEESKSENGSELSDNEFPADGASEVNAVVDGYSKPLLRKRVPAAAVIPIPVEVKGENVDKDGNEVVKRKRGRPRKVKDSNEKRKKISHPPNDQIIPRKEPSSSSVALKAMVNDVTSLSSFKPMGFEMSFLQFLEQTNKPEVPLVAKVELTDVCKRVPGLFAKDTCVLFSNPQNLKSLSNVRVVIDKAYSGAAHKVLKQIQDMRPKVVLKRTVSL